MGGKGKKRTDLKKGVPFKMMFRHHMDPDYYDPKANDKIFVPEVLGANLTEAQKKIVETFPERDRGIYDASEKTSIIETDPLEAAVKKMKMRKEQRMKDIAAKAQKEGKFLRYKAEGSDDDSEDSAEYFEDSQEEEKEYHTGSEEEEVEDEEEKIETTTVETTTKNMRPAEGVKFVQYDQYGVPVEPDSDTGFDYQRHIVTDDLRPSDMYIEASAEMVARMTAKPTKAGVRRDVDKDPALMSAEERAVFQCLEDEELAYGEDADYDLLEDDFLLLANDGQPALVEVDSKRAAAANTEEFDNKGVIIVRDEEAEALTALREELKKRFHLSKAQVVAEV